MTRFVANLLASILAFIAGVVTASSWTSKKVTVIDRPPVVLERCPPGQTPPASKNLPVTADYVPEFVFAQGRLKLVPERVRLRSESLRYDINVTYPQIVGSEAAQIHKINQQIKDRVTEQFQWPLKPSPAALRWDQSGAYNVVNLTYGNGLATDSFLSIHIIGYSFDIGVNHTDNHRLVMNYDLTSGKQLKLSDMFKPGANYLEFISGYSFDQIAKGSGFLSGFPTSESFTPKAENFDDWTITPNGINFNFDGCKLGNCMRPDETVEIPFADLKPFLKPGVPGKFKITYP